MSLPMNSWTCNRKTPTSVFKDKINLYLWPDSGLLIISETINSTTGVSNSSGCTIDWRNKVEQMKLMRFDGCQNYVPGLVTNKSKSSNDFKQMGSRERENRVLPQDCKGQGCARLKLGTKRFTWVSHVDGTGPDTSVICHCFPQAVGSEAEQPLHKPVPMLVWRQQYYPPQHKFLTQFIRDVTEMFWTCLS